MRQAGLFLAGVGASGWVRLSGWRAPLRLSVPSAAPPAPLAALVRAVEREPEFVPGVCRVRVLDRGADGPAAPLECGGLPPLSSPAWQTESVTAAPLRPGGCRVIQAPAGDGEERCPPPIVPGSDLLEGSRSFFRGPGGGRESEKSGGKPPYSKMGWVRYEVGGAFCGLPWNVRFCKAWEGDRRFVWRSEAGTGWPEQEGELRLWPEGTGTRILLQARTRSALPLLGGAGTLLVNPLFLAPAFSGWLLNLARAAEADRGG